MGDEADDILRSLVLSANNAKKYKVVKEEFDGHFVKWRNVIYERARFNQRRQEWGESVDAFITALYGLAENCAYRIYLNSSHTPNSSRPRIVAALFASSKE